MGDKSVLSRTRRHTGTAVSLSRLLPIEEVLARMHPLLGTVRAYGGSNVSVPLRKFVYGSVRALVASSLGALRGRQDL
jgi:hypothetical protein